MKTILEEMRAHLQEGIIPFWLKRGIDHTYGGYLTCIDENGIPTSDTDKYIVTQTRMIWGFSAFGGFYKDQCLLEAAKQGVDFFIKYFWDSKYGGWFWKTARDGQVIDKGKLVYGQSFAIYVLAEYHRHTGDPVSLDYARKTFDLLQKYSADTLHGGYYENLEPDWTASPSGFAAGDRKSLDIHMHLMEAYTVLAQCTNEEIHLRKLEEVTQLIMDKMINKSTGCGLNQFDLDFNSIPAINIKRTWNAERETGQTIKQQIDSTSYGHNLELAWLFDRAGEILHKPAGYFNKINKKLIDHALTYGFDHDKGGVYRDGPHNGPALVLDKEFWQNAEALVGLLDGYEQLGEDKYLEAFIKNWEFARKYMIHPQLGEWRQLVDKDGNILAGSIGNPWKACYHSGRSIMECICRLERLMGTSERVKVTAKKSID